MHFPFNCFVFMSLFYEAIGFGAWRIGFIVFVFWMGSAVGGWFAGWLGGYAAKNHGGGMARIAVAQIGYALSVVTVCITFLVSSSSPYTPSCCSTSTGSQPQEPACRSQGHCINRARHDIMESNCHQDKACRPSPSSA